MQRVVQRARRVEVVAERLLDDDARPALALALALQPDARRGCRRSPRTPTAAWRGRRAGCRACRARRRSAPAAPRGRGRRAGRRTRPAGRRCPRRSRRHSAGSTGLTRECCVDAPRASRSGTRRRYSGRRAKPTTLVSAGSSRRGAGCRCAGRILRWSGRRSRRR